MSLWDLKMLNLFLDVAPDAEGVVSRWAFVREACLSLCVKMDAWLSTVP